MKSDVVDIRGQIHAMTDRAVLFSDDGDRDGAKWLPLSQVEVEKHSHGVATITLPEWLALERGLI